MENVYYFNVMRPRVFIRAKTYFRRVMDEVVLLPSSVPRTNH